tara:strand:+ start:136 stop:372 length:237 start_codon:yes stop_codon:yes gene_type:complete
MSAPENPQAFPTGDFEHGGHDGMTLRDWFAGQALNAFIDEREGDRAIWEGNEHYVAEQSYRFADAMLAARTQSKDTPQ